MSGNANAPLRGELWWVDLNPTQGAEINKIRPCVVVGSDPINRARSTVVVVPLSSSPKPKPPIVLPLPSVPSNEPGAVALAVLDQIRAIDKRRLKRYIGTLSFADLQKLNSALRQVLVLA